MTVAAALDAVRAAAAPYLVVAGSHLEPDYQRWLALTLPHAAVTVWPGSGHFPHIAHPRRFADCLAVNANQSRPAVDGQRDGGKDRGASGAAHAGRARAGPV